MFFTSALKHGKHTEPAKTKWSDFPRDRKLHKHVTSGDYTQYIPVEETSPNKKTGPDDGPHPDRKTNISAEVVSVQPDGGSMMVRVPGIGVRKVSGGAAGIAEIEEGSTVKVNIGTGNKVTLSSPKNEDTKRTAGPRTKGKQP